MSGALWIGTTGLAASEKQMDVIGNNLANANTVGFKAADTFFASMLSQSLAGGSSGAQRVGQGVSVASVATQFAQGSFQSTGNVTDMAIDGNGFFILTDNDGNSLYTRAGGFKVANTGLLVDSNGYRVQGYSYNDKEEEIPILWDLNLRDVLSRPRATTTFEVGLMLDSQTVPGDIFSSSQSVYDSGGQEHILNTQFTNTEGSGYWGVQNYLDSKAATSESFSGIKFDLNTGVIDKIYMSTITNVVTTGTGSATSKINRPGQLYKSSAETITLTRGVDANAWTITNHGEYPNMTLELATTGLDDSVDIDLDGAGGADITFTLTGAWADSDTIEFDIVQTETEPTDGTLRFYPPGGATLTGSTAVKTFNTDLKVTAGAAGAVGNDVTLTIQDDGAGTVLSVTGQGTDDIIVHFDNANAAQTNEEIARLLNGIATATAGDLSATGGNTKAAAQAATALLGGVDGATIGTNGDGNITWNMAGDDAPNIRSYASASSISMQGQDGYKKGDLTSLDVNKSGVVEGMFSNGKRQKLAMILLATFRNINGLNKIGSYFSETAESGKVNPAKPATGGLGEIMANSLEMSNTDVAKEFIKMITAQRAYQSSARIITATDQMLQELMNVKR